MLPTSDGHVQGVKPSNDVKYLALTVHTIVHTIIVVICNLSQRKGLSHILDVAISQTFSPYEPVVKKAS